MTPGKAALLELRRRYLSALSDTVVTLLESHKLMYFYEESGANTNLQIVKGHYGPYSLKHVLTKLEGHFMMGFGDASEEPGKNLERNRDAMTLAPQFLKSRSELQYHMQQVEDLICSFETAAGMELLASVHWVAKHEQNPATSAEDAVRLAHQGTPRKKDIFPPEHIKIAWDTLHKKGWI